MRTSLCRLLVEKAQADDSIACIKIADAPAEETEKLVCMLLSLFLARCQRFIALEKVFIRIRLREVKSWTFI